MIKLKTVSINQSSVRVIVISINLLEISRIQLI